MTPVITQRAGMSTEELLPTQEEHPYYSSPFVGGIGENFLRF